MRQFMYIIIGFLVILFVFMAVFYMTYPCIIRFIKFIYVKWNKLSGEKRECILVILFVVLMLYEVREVSQCYR